MEGAESTSCKTPPLFVKAADRPPRQNPVLLTRSPTSRTGLESVDEPISGLSKSSAKDAYRSAPDLRRLAVAECGACMAEAEHPKHLRGKRGALSRGARFLVVTRPPCCVAFPDLPLRH
ncbi:hypothetical protein GCM10011578_087900 [Streptomyces fuscichromogenes]|uniref:Uncharacterized protein n=1 Tax=Streptomyces fuscichromogenes TaxID=1324013 RepID=A0A918CWS6_9ACTN|nr:hypothetical protein GCM10011578_087900 [Streptomyces fuscichromogenes]